MAFTNYSMANSMCKVSYNKHLAWNMCTAADEHTRFTAHISNSHAWWTNSFGVAVALLKQKGSYTYIAEVHQEELVLL